VACKPALIEALRAAQLDLTEDTVT